MNYSPEISKWKLYQNFLNISLISSPQSPEFMCFSTEKYTDAMNLQRPYLNPKPSYSKSRSVGRGGTLNATSVHDVLIDHCYTTTPGFCHHRINCSTFDGNELGGKGSKPLVDNHCRSIHLCCRDSIAWNSRVFPPLHSVSVTGRHIAACTVCGWQFMISTHCSSVKFLMSCSALKTGDHSPNFEL